MTDVHVEDATGTDPQQRFLLELKSARPTGWDVYDIAPDFPAEYLPYIKKFDILGMATAKVLAISKRLNSRRLRNNVTCHFALPLITRDDPPSEAGCEFTELTLLDMTWTQKASNIPEKREKT